MIYDVSYPQFDLKISVAAKRARFSRRLPEPSLPSSRVAHWAALGRHLCSLIRSPGSYFQLSTGSIFVSRTCRYQPAFVVPPPHTTGHTAPAEERLEWDSAAKHVGSILVEDNVMTYEGPLPIGDGSWSSQRTKPPRRPPIVRSDGRFIFRYISAANIATWTALVAIVWV